MDPQELKKAISSGLLSFPLTDFDAAGDFDPAGYAARLEWLKPYGASALFAAGGTGEFFSLEAAEYSRVISAAVDACRDEVPIIAGAGYSTRLAAQFAKTAEDCGPGNHSWRNTPRGRCQRTIGLGWASTLTSCTRPLSPEMDGSGYWLGVLRHVSRVGV